jgi:hypothetical protein
MPFPLLPTVLGISFGLVWAFIGAMILRDGQIAARRERDADGQILRLIPPRRPDLPPARPSAAFLKRRRRRLVRQAPIRAAS